MYYFSEMGITEIQEISFSAIDMLFHTDFHYSKDTRKVYLLHARFMLGFFACLNIIPVELSSMLDDRIYFQVGRMELFSSENQILLEQFRNKSSLFLPASSMNVSLPLKQPSKILDMVLPS